MSRPSTGSYFSRVSRVLLLVGYTTFRGSSSSQAVLRHPHSPFALVLGDDTKDVFPYLS